ncbi:PREDICTED: UPF0235 protein C15orf40 homolog [Priapulus caudatus]|uniref:UPF0235 protein C15orf40 homolog n=1 Tax=Priapulus caudatus TaxID=37621 RepID=A0ABM1EUE3_PRICU|nr:PREDICTED: UPF0235 protein C15orf40 homolog [Priapulus caudatus]
MPRKRLAANIRGNASTENQSPSLVTNETGPVIQRERGVVLKIQAKPGSKHNCITDISSESIGVQIAAPPVEGQANTELISYLSSVLSLKKSHFSLDKGSRSRIKLLSVEGADISKDSILELLKMEMNGHR